MIQSTRLISSSMPSHRARQPVQHRQPSRYMRPPMHHRTQNPKFQSHCRRAFSDDLIVSSLNAVLNSGNNEHHDLEETQKKPIKPNSDIILNGSYSWLNVVLPSNRQAWHGPQQLQGHRQMQVSPYHDLHPRTVKHDSKFSETNNRAHQVRSELLSTKICGRLFLSMSSPTLWRILAIRYVKLWVSARRFM